MYIRTTNLLALYIRSTRRYDHPLFGGPGPIGAGPGGWVIWRYLYLPKKPRPAPIIAPASTAGTRLRVCGTPLGLPPRHGLEPRPADCLSRSTGPSPGPRVPRRGLQRGRAAPPAGLASWRARRHGGSGTATPPGCLATNPRSPARARRQPPWPPLLDGATARCNGVPRTRSMGASPWGEGSSYGPCALRPKRCPVSREGGSPRFRAAYRRP